MYKTQEKFIKFDVYSYKNFCPSRTVPTMKHFVFIFSLILPLGSLQAEELKLLNPEQLQSIQAQQSPLIIDVRTPAEWQATGIIPNSHKLQGFDSNGQFDAVKWTAELEKLKTAPNQAVILVCRSGNRSGKIGEILLKQGQNNIYHLQNGIQGWIQTGHPVQAE